MMDVYGVRERTEEPAGVIGRVAESIAVRGWAPYPGFVSATEAKDLRVLVEKTYRDQLSRFGVSNFDAIRDSNVARALACEHRAFADLALSTQMMSLVSRLLGEYFVLFTNNGVLSPPASDHEQQRWHRDLNYQHWVASRPISVSVLLALDAFSPISGGTQVLTGTHLQELAPSQWFCEAYAESPVLEPGDALVFNSMIFHRQGRNTSADYRYAINHVFTLPFVAQQVDFLDVASRRGMTQHLTPEQVGVLGGLVAWSRDPDQWRKERLSHVDSKS